MLNKHRLKKLSLALFLLVMVTTLSFGLTPRGNFKADWVEPDPHYDATFFAGYGYAWGTLTEFANHSSSVAITQLKLTLLMQEQTGSKFRVLIYIGQHCEDDPFIIGQWKSHLIVMQGCDFANKLKLVRLSHNMKSHLGLMTSVNITLDNASNELHINDELVSTESGVLYSAPNEPTLPIFIGNTPDGKLGWTGTIAEFTINQISKATGETRTIRDYQFASSSVSDSIVDSSAAAQTLHIPKPGQFPVQNRLVRQPLSSLWQDQRFDVLVNLLGFIPLGFATALMLAYYSRLRQISFLLTTVIIATLVSLSIELSQVYIAGRRSNMHDLVLNSIGSFFGFAAFYSLLFLRSLYNRKLTGSNSTVEEMNSNNS